MKNTLQKLNGLGLVIFDCDGVLVDSMAGHTKVEFQVLSDLDIVVTPEQLLANAGKPFKSLALSLASDSGVTLPADFDVLLAEKKAEYFTHHLKPIPGIHQALEELGDTPLCVASGSPLPGVHHSLEVTGLAKFFKPEWVFSSETDMVAKGGGKPFPDLFQLAARQAGVPCQNCVVVEDAGSGVKGAKAAGMAPLGFTGGSHCGEGHARMLEEAGAVITFVHMNQLTSVLKNPAIRLG